MLRATVGRHAAHPIHAPLWAPTHADSYTYATGTLHRGGTLLRVRLHAHLLQDTLLHAASPEELGYTAARGGTGGPRGTLVVAGSPWSMTASLGPCARPASQAPRPCGRACSPCRSSCAPPTRALCYRRRPAVRACGRRAVRRLALRGRRDIHAHHPDSRHTCPPANRRATRLHEWLPADPPVLRPRFYASDDGQAHMSYDRYSASAESLLDRDVHACVQLAREAVVPAAPPTLPPPPPSLPAVAARGHSARRCCPVRRRLGWPHAAVCSGALLRRRAAWRGSYRKG